MKNSAVQESLFAPAPEKEPVKTHTPQLPPMLTQYLQYKREYPDCLLFFQVGDFYELFFDDAVTTSRTLNLTLTSRDKNNANPIPMCGVPVGVIDGYLERLVAAGYSVAIVSQVAPAAGEAVKGMMARKLERIVTPGVKVLATSDPHSEDNLLAAVHIGADSESAAIAFCAVESGVIWVRESLQTSSLVSEMSRIGPVEVVLPKSIEGKKLDKRLPWVKELDALLSGTSVKYRLERTHASSGRDLSTLKGFSALSAAAKAAVRLLADFIDETTVNSRVSFQEVCLRTFDTVMAIDATTRGNLELVRNIRNGGTQGTLLGCIDRTVSTAGGRLLRGWIRGPAKDLHVINDRLEAVRILKDVTEARRELREALTYCADLERLAARLELQALLPRELGALRDTLQKIPALKENLKSLLKKQKSARLAGLEKDLNEITKLRARLEEALSDNPPLSVQDGGIIREGFDAGLDELRQVKATGRSWIAELEAKERTRTGISSLKIRYNNVIGFFIELTKTQAPKAPTHFIRRQSTANSERFTTEELARKESDVMGAEEKVLQIERKIYDALRAECVVFCPELRALSQTIAEIDVLLSFADISDREGFVEPVVDESTELVIEAGKHPVVAAIVQGNFVPNDLLLSRESSWAAVLTGPNMGGKSTYLRQAAIIVLLAQMGCFVPAKRARIGIVDRIFARIGASDDLLEGESTFMVEMREASHIVQSASDRSLVLIDEIGRGTATADGLAIARAILEWIVSRLQCRLLFATHFHELTGLSESLLGVKNISVGSVEDEGNVIFTHEICEGPANQSYGIEVAKLSGLPEALIARARDLLVEKAPVAVKGAGKNVIPMVKTVAPKDYEELKAVSAEIAKVDLNQTTPMEALGILQELRMRVAKHT